MVTKVLKQYWAPLCSYKKYTGKALTLLSRACKLMTRSDSTVLVTRLEKVMTRLEQVMTRLWLNSKKF